MSPYKKKSKKSVKKRRCPSGHLLCFLYCIILSETASDVRESNDIGVLNAEHRPYVDRVALDDSVVFLI